MPKPDMYIVTYFKPLILRMQTEMHMYITVIYVWLYTKFKLIFIKFLIPGTLWLVSMADNGTEVIPLVLCV